MNSAIYSWHPVLTPHQSHTLHALGKSLGLPVRAIVAKSEDNIRRAQGWAADDGALVDTEVLPQTGWRQRVEEIFEGDPHALHLFGSPFERSPINVALYSATKRRRRIFLISEPYSPKAVGYLTDGVKWRDALKAKLRPTLYALYGWLLRHRVDGVFAISPLAVEQFSAMGIKRVYPFGYFVPSDDVPPTARAEAPLDVAYLGSFIARKGVASLLQAFRNPIVRSSGARLTLYGPDGNGVPAADLENVRYGGALPFGKVQATLAQHDLLVVPSLYDGWAVVVNEAVQAGVGVIASDTVGAGAMIGRWGCGARFAAGSSLALADAISTLAAEPDRLAEWRRQAKLLAPFLEPQVAGAYMSECIASCWRGSEPPEAPWY